MSIHSRLSDGQYTEAENTCDDVSILTLTFDLLGLYIPDVFRGSKFFVTNFKVWLSVQIVMLPGDLDL